MNATKLYVPKMSNFGPTCKKKIKIRLLYSNTSKTWGYWLILKSLVVTLFLSIFPECCLCMCPKAHFQLAKPKSALSWLKGESPSFWKITCSSTKDTWLLQGKCSGLFTSASFHGPLFPYLITKKNCSNISNYLNPFRK